MNTVQLTTNLSIIVQLLTGLIGVNGLFVDLPEKHKILQNILKLELGVQFVEFFFLYFFYSINGIDIIATSRFSTLF